MCCPCAALEGTPAKACWVGLSANMRSWRAPRGRRLRRCTNSDSVERLSVAVGAMREPARSAFVFVESLESRYRLLQCIGRGSFGEVQLASRRDDASGARAFAVKIFDKAPPSWVRGPQRRLTRSFVFSGVAIGLRHPNIVRFLEFVVDESRSSVELARIVPVMEALHGPDLFDWLALRRAEVASGRGTWITTRDVACIAGQVLRGLQYLHDGKVRLVHRDVKPENFRFAACEPDADLKLVDFGTVFVSGFKDAMEGLVVGTPRYRAPEAFAPVCASRGPPSPALDMYSFGVVLFLLYSGYFPRAPSNGAAMKGPADTSAFPWHCIPDDVADLLRALLAEAPEMRKSAAVVLLHDCLRGSCGSLGKPGELDAVELPMSSEPIDRLRLL
mmetsp:Transcript_47119/g.131478  ORF Transcript_47119/g.131478 Transcript_47119/m.131478 type:complete len:388 (+) Transcript_47119:2-1165(+)